MLEISTSAEVLKTVDHNKYCKNGFYPLESAMYHSHVAHISGSNEALLILTAASPAEATIRKRQGRSYSPHALPTPFYCDCLLQSTGV